MNTTSRLPRSVWQTKRRFWATENSPLSFKMIFTHACDQDPLAHALGANLVAHGERAWFEPALNGHIRVSWDPFQQGFVK